MEAPEETKKRAKNFLRFLAVYGPTSQNEAQYTEDVINSSQKYSIEQPIIPSELPGRFCKQLMQGTSIVVTGRAGDGKTHLCRTVKELLVNDSSLNAPIETIHLRDNLECRILKDLTELGAVEAIHHLQELNRFAREENPSVVYFIMANEGRLVARLRGKGDKSEVISPNTRDELSSLAEAVEDMLNIGTENVLSFPNLCVYNLSLLSGAESFKKVLRAICNHKGFSDLEQAYPDCPQLVNRNKMLHPQILERITNLVEMLDYNNEHLTMRELFILVVNIILGNGKHTTMDSCLVKDPEMYMKEGSRYLNSNPIEYAYYSNILGKNLPKHHRLRKRPFSVINTLGLGGESNNRLDALMIYGDLSDKYKDDYLRIICKDDLLNSTKYEELRAHYLSSADKDKQFFKEIEALRSRAYFEMPSELTERYGHHELTAYRSMPQYKEVIYMLQQGKQVQQKIITRILVGLNRVFTGSLCENDDLLYLATNGCHSQSRISRVLSYKIPHDDSGSDYQGLQIVSRYKNSEYKVVPVLKILHRGKCIGSISLTLSRFEFLWRVSQGSLPSSLSEESYEDFIVFKSQMIKFMEKSFKSSSSTVSWLVVNPSDGRILEQKISLEESLR